MYQDIKLLKNRYKKLLCKFKELTKFVESSLSSNENSGGFATRVMTVSVSSSTTTIVITPTTGETFDSVLLVQVNGVSQVLGASSFGYTVSNNTVTLTETIGIDSTPDAVTILYQVTT